MNYLEKFYELMGNEKADKFWYKKLFPEFDDNAKELPRPVSDLAKCYGWENAASRVQSQLIKHNIPTKGLGNILVIMSDEILSDIFPKQVGFKGSWGNLPGDCVDANEDLCSEVNSNYITLLINGLDETFRIDGEFLADAWFGKKKFGDDDDDN